MMQLTLFPTPKMGGTVCLPASKSLSNRALLIAALSQKGHVLDDEACRVLQHLSDCDDTRVMMAALRHLPQTVDVGAAGTAMRFLTACLAVTPGQRLITGTERMRHRPIAPLVEALRQLGAGVEYAGQEGFPPLRIDGRELRGGRLEMPGGVSSQYISALLMIGPLMQEGLSLHLTGGVVSRPYIDMTLGLMQHFGAKAGWTGESSLRVESGGYSPVPYYIEGDWSASSYWYEMVALSDDEGAEVHLPGLWGRSLQGDSAVRDMFLPLGVETLPTRDGDGLEGVVLRKTKRTAERLDLDFSDQPDLAQTLVVTCAMLDVPFRFTGLQSLKIKETDRMAALCRELGKLGYVLREELDSVLQWEGERTEPQPDVAIDTYEDHRMAMSFAPVCMKRGMLRLNNPQVVSKSYPSFWEDLRRMGFKL